MKIVLDTKKLLGFRIGAGNNADAMIGGKAGLKAGSKLGAKSV